MADNTTLNTGTGGDVIASDDISSVKYQRVKMIHGADGTNDGDVSRSNPLPVTEAFSTRSDTFTVSGNGTTVDASTKPHKNFSLQVQGTGAAASAWNVVVEGSLNNSKFTTILEHSNAGEFRNAADGETVWFNGGPFFYFRSRCVSITLGSATNVVATIVGQS